MDIKVAFMRQRRACLLGLVIGAMSLAIGCGTDSGRPPASVATYQPNQKSKTTTGGMVRSYNVATERSHDSEPEAIR